MDDSLAALALGRVEPKPRVGDDRLMAFQTTMSLVGLGWAQGRTASEDSYLAIWSATKPENLAADVRFRWNGGHECREDVSMRGSQP